MERAKYLRMNDTKVCRWTWVWVGNQSTI